MYFIYPEREREIKKMTLIILTKYRQIDRRELQRVEKLTGIIKIIRDTDIT